MHFNFHLVFSFLTIVICNSLLFSQENSSDSIKVFKSETLQKGNSFISLTSSYGQTGFIGQSAVGRSYSIIPAFEFFYRNKISHKTGIAFFNSSVFGFKDSNGNALGGRLRDFYFHTSLNKHFNTRKDKWLFNLSIGICLGYENWKSHYKPIVQETVFSYNLIIGGGIVYAPKKILNITNPRIRFHMDIYIPLRIGKEITFVPGGVGIKYKLN